MLNTKSFLAVDFGAANLKLAEFELTEEGGLRLLDYTFGSLGQEGMQEATREAAMQSALQQALAGKSFGAKNLNACAPGFHTFAKFVKLPPVDTSKVTQIIQYEAQQNVPFPLEEVVWDYQILGATSTGQLEVMLVAIKSDIVEGLFRVAEGSGLRLQLVDVSPAALCNAFRYNYGDLEGCTMLLDIGAKTSNLLFFEKGSIFARGINIGASSITQDFAKEARLGFPEAEKLKIEQGFVSLGGAYEEPENEHQAAISKIARQVMTRLHIQVNQTVQFYRQQGGSSPERLFLSGGAAIMPYTAQFFSEKLNVSVEYFNPFRNIQMDPALNLEELAKVAHSLGEVVGLALRNLAHCPVELNLMPRSSIQRQALNQKKPYLIAALGCLIMVLFAFGMFYQKVAAEKGKALDKLTAGAAPVLQSEQPLKKEMNLVKLGQVEGEQLTLWMEDGVYWAEILQNLRTVFQEVEEKTGTELSKAESKVEAGLWVEKLKPSLIPGERAMAADPSAPNSGATASPGAGTAPRNNAMGGPRNRPGGAPAGDPGKQVRQLTLLCRGINLKSVAPAADNQMAYAVAEAIKARTNYFDPGTTRLTGDLLVDQDDLTFTFEVVVGLKRPINL